MLDTNLSAIHTEIGLVSPSKKKASDYFVNDDTNYTILNTPSNTNNSLRMHSRRVSGILRAGSHNSHIYCKTGCYPPSTSDIQFADNNNSPILVMNASCYRGSQANITSYYGAIDKENDDFIYTNDISIVQGAGNEGEGTGF